MLMVFLVIRELIISLHLCIFNKIVGEYQMNRYVKLMGFIVCISLAGIASGCGDQSSHPVSVSSEKNNGEIITITDSLGRNVVISKNVKRAAITNAYNAELITAIGAADKIAGVDYYIYQDKAGFKNRFTKENLIGSSQGGLNYEKIANMNPDVLILCENDNWQNAEEKLKVFGIPVVVCNAYYTDQIFDNVNMLGKIFNEEKKAKEFIDYFSSKLEYINSQLKNVQRKTVYFEYRTPGRTTIPGDYFYEMVNKAHGDNIFSEAKATQIQIDDVVKRNPSYIVKVSEANVYSSYIPPTLEDMKRIKAEIISRPGWDSIDAVRDNHILLMSHYIHGGASKLVGTMYIAKFLYPEYLPDLHPEEIFHKWVSDYEGLEYHSGHTYPTYKMEE